MCCKGKIYPGFLRLSIKKNVKLFYEFLKSDYILRSCSKKHGLKKTFKINFTCFPFTFLSSNQTFGAIYLFIHSFK